jgi:hypothetical protein
VISFPPGKQTAFTNGLMDHRSHLLVARLNQQVCVERQFQWASLITQFWKGSQERARSQNAYAVALRQRVNRLDEML